MKYFVKELNKGFETKKELFKALKKNQKLLMDKKKSTIKEKVNAGVIGFLDKKDNTVKALPNMEDDFIYPIISNTNYLDSHDDVHLNGSMNKTAKDQSGKIYYLADHKPEIDNVIALPKDVEIYIQTVKWSDIGRNYEGETEVMVFKIHKDNIEHEKFLKFLNKGHKFPNSIRMIYVKYDVAYNSKDPEYAEEYKVWNEVSPLIVNKERLEQQPFFYAVRELRIVLEGSAVLDASNDATTTDSKTKTKKKKPSEDTSKKPPKSTSPFYKQIINQ